VKKIFYVSMLTLSTMSTVTMAADQAIQTNFTSDQVKQIQQITRDYLIKNPDVLVAASQTLQQQEAQKQMIQGKEGIKANIAALINPPGALIAGNPQGSITLVEFFDYQCAHCKEMSASIDSLIKANPNLRIVFKDFPIFGQSSVLAAAAAFAANQQGKYYAFHQALLNSDGPLTEDKVYAIAQKLGLDVNRLKSDMSSNQKAINDMLAANFSLVKALGLVGTPAFIAAKTNATKNSDIEFFPGALPQDKLQDMITKAEKS